MTVRDVAEELGISERSAWRLVAQGELPVHQFGASTRVRREDLDAFIGRCRRRQDAPSDEDDSDEPTSGG